MPGLVNLMKFPLPTPILMQSSTPTRTAYPTISPSTRAATPWHSSRQEELASWYRHEAIAYGLSLGLILQHDLPAHDPILLLSRLLKGTQITLPDERTPTISEYERPAIPHEDEALALLLDCCSSSSKVNGHFSPLEWMLEVQSGKDIKFDVSEIMLASGNQRLEQREWLGAIKWAHDTGLVTTWLPLQFDALGSRAAAAGHDPVDAAPDFHAVPELPADWLEAKAVHEEELSGEIYQRRISLLEDLRLTPPLMPTLSAEDHCERTTPRIENLQLEPLSDPASLWSLDMMSAETAIGVGDERPSSHPSIIGEMRCPSVQEVIRSNQSRGDLTIEPPMLPPSTNDTETSSDEIRTQLQTLWPRSVPSSSDTVEHEFKESLASIAADTLKVMEQEKFLPADAIARFQVPPVDFSVADLPWTKIGRNIIDHFVFVCKETPELLILPPAPKGPFTERQLSWRLLQGKPADYVMTETLYHSIEGEAMWDCWRHDIEENPFLPGRPAPAEPDYGDDEDMDMTAPRDQPVTLEVVDPPAAEDLGALIRKRRSEGGGGASTLPKRQRPQHGDDVLQFSAAYSASQRVESYMQRNGCLPVPSVGSPCSSASALPQITPRARKGLKEATRRKPVQERTSTKPGKNAMQPHALPPLRFPEHPCRVFASMQCLELTRAMLRLWANVEFLDRDMSSHDRFFRDPGSLKQHRIVSPLSYEADLIISPLTAIMFADLGTLAKESTFRERVCRVAPLYGHLVILVASLLEPADWMAYNDFVAFASSLPWSVSVTLVAKDKEALAHWAIAVMCRHAHEGAQLGRSIYPQETAEEILLRRVGFNIYAAQAAIGLTPRWMFSLAGAG